jgi:hypothetical protein
MIWSFRGFLSQGGTPLSLDGLFHGKSQNKMDENWIPVLANLHNLFFWLLADFKAIKYGRRTIKQNQGADKASHDEPLSGSAFLGAFWGIGQQQETFLKGRTILTGSRFLAFLGHTSNSKF